MFTRRQILKAGGAAALTVPLAEVTLSATGPAEADWREAYPIRRLTPKRKIGGVIRFNDPSFFYAQEGRLVTHHGRFKRHRTFMFPHLRMERYPYALRVRLRKRDTVPVRAGLIFGAKTPYEFEVGSAKSHGALFVYVGSHTVEFRDHRTYETSVWKDASSDLSSEWKKGGQITLDLAFEEQDPYGAVSARVTGAVEGAIPATAIDLGKPDEVTSQPHIRGKGFWGVAVDGPGEVEILDVSFVPETMRRRRKALTPIFGRVSGACSKQTPPTTSPSRSRCARRV